MTASNGRAAACEIDARRQIARQDLGFAHCTIFSPRVRGPRRWLERRRPYFKHGWIEVDGPELDSTDLIVLIAILHVAGAASPRLDPCSEHAGLIRSAEGPGTEQECVPVRVRIGDIAELIGRDRRAGSAHRMIWASVKRLMGTIVSAESASGNTRIASQLIQPSATSGAWLATALNWRGTRAVLGRGQWAPISLFRMRGATGIERVLMHRLAAHCVGHALPIKLNTLVDKCWARPPKDSGDRKKRRQRVRAALPKCLPDGVTASVDSNDTVTFRNA